uniref:Uncharacterized protein n=1 Tax=Anguilla anguilla TaxID=7936 RepID=A0A0E9VCA8_ANGAN
MSLFLQAHFREKLCLKTLCLLSVVL